MTFDASSRTSCDTEEIHLIGAVQPHGALLVVDADTLHIRYVCENFARMAGQSTDALLSQPLAAVLDAHEVANLGQSTDSTVVRRTLRPIQIALSHDPATLHECIPHAYGGLLYLEFFAPVPNSHTQWEEDDLRRQVISDLIRPKTLTELAELSADIVRKVNGFDRVMIYRFAEDNHGEVIAESTERQDSYLGLHYPASDIPEPARRHFVLNVVRTIADVHATGIPVRAGAGEGPLDLSFSVLRAVPETHVQYLKNMGVSASMSISLVANDQLWGLIACHHYEPRAVSTQVLRFTELLAGTISALLQGIENRMQLSRAIESEQIAFAMEKQGRAGTPLRDVVAQWAPELMRLLDAQGLVFRQSGKVSEYGAVPSPRLRYLPLRKQLVEGIAATPHLGALLDLTPEQVEVSAGAGYMELSGDGQDYLVLARQHFEQVVTWAGKPDTVEEKLADGTTRLNPRASFSLWTEERAGQSKPFDQTDLEALRIVRRALFALNSLERERAAVMAQKEAEAEEEKLRLALLDAARKTSMGELASALAHELNQPLAAVSNYINACRAQLANFDVKLPDGFEALMLDAVSESMRASDLVRRLRDFIGGGALQIEEADLFAAVRQGAELAMVAHGADPPELVFDFSDDMPPVWIDRIQIGQIILNLAMNAITAMRDSPTRILTIRARPEDRFVRISVIDTGPGIANEMRTEVFEPFHSTTTSGMGIGLSLCRSIVEAHGGKIAAPKVSRGGIVEFTLPIGAGETA